MLYNHFCKGNDDNPSGGNQMIKAVVGANWGDEGKGKITDMLAKEADITGPGVGPLPQADAVREQLAGDRRVVRVVGPRALR